MKPVLSPISTRTWPSDWRKHVRPFGGPSSFRPSSPKEKEKESKATINHYKVAKQKSNSLNTIAYIKLKVNVDSISVMVRFLTEVVFSTNISWIRSYFIFIA